MSLTRRILGSCSSREETTWREVLPFPYVCGTVRQPGSTFTEQVVEAQDLEGIPVSFDCPRAQRRCLVDRMVSLEVEDCE